MTYGQLRELAGVPPRWAPVAPSVLVFVMLALALVLTACGGPPRAARVATAASAVAVAELDAEVAPRLREASQRIRAELREIGGTFAQWEERMGPWSSLERALVEAKSALLQIEAALDAWDAGVGGSGAFLGVVSCAVPAFDELLDQLERGRVDRPPSVDKLRQAVALLVALGGGSCPATSGGES